MLPYLTAYLFYFDSETISGIGGLCFATKKFVNFFEEKSESGDLA